MKRLFWLLGTWLLLATSNVEAKTDTVTVNVEAAEALYYFFKGPASTEIETYAIDPDSNDTIFSDKRTLAPGEWHDYDISDGRYVWKVKFYSSNAPRTIKLFSTTYSGFYSDTACDISIGVSGISYETEISLDVSGCTSLTSLNCRSNSLKSLDVSGCTALTSLDCSFNNLTELDISTNTALTSLNCRGNSLTSLYVSGLPALTSLNCRDNSLTSLDVSGCISLTSLVYHYGNLTHLDVSGCTALTSLDCSYNNLTELDISTNTALTSLDCSSNNLTELDISTNTALTSLYCHWNGIALSALYKVYMKNNSWNPFLAHGQSESIILLLNQPWDLSTERIIGQITTDYELTDAYNREVSADFWEENRFVFQFHEPLRYTLTLQNPTLENSYYEYYDEDGSITFTWNISVVEELPENYFTVNVASNNTEWGTATISGTGIYEGGKRITITAKPKEGYRFVNWTKRDGTEFCTEEVHLFAVTENLELTANFEKQPEGAANESGENDNFRVYAQNLTIYLSEDRGSVQVYNMAGQCVYNGHATSIPVPQSGVYIVAVGPQRFKVPVR